MAVLLSPVGGVAAQFFTNAGVPLSGGKIYTYAAGTSTPQATYTTGAGNVQHSNPIVLDAAGRVPTGEIWLTDGLSYKFVLKDANDVLIATYDNIVGINSNFVNFVNQQEIQTATAGQTVFTLTTMLYQPGTGNLSVFVDGVNQYGPGAQYAYTETSDSVVTFVSGLHVGASVKFTTTEIQNSGIGDASQITYTYPDANAVQESVEERLAQYVSIKDFGAIGDGVTDDIDAYKAFLTAINNSKAIGSIPNGTYYLSTGIDFSSYAISNCTIISGNAVLNIDSWGANDVGMQIGSNVSIVGSLTINASGAVGTNGFLNVCIAIGNWDDAATEVQNISIEQLNLSQNDADANLLTITSNTHNVNIGSIAASGTYGCAMLAHWSGVPNNTAPTTTYHPYDIRIGSVDGNNSTYELVGLSSCYDVKIDSITGDNNAFGFKSIGGDFGNQYAGSAQADFVCKNIKIGSMNLTNVTTIGAEINASAGLISNVMEGSTFIDSATIKGKSGSTNGIQIQDQRGSKITANVSFFDGTGIRFNNCLNSTISNSVVEKCGDRGIYFYGTSGGEVSGCSIIDTALIANNQNAAGGVSNVYLNAYASVNTLTNLTVTTDNSATHGIGFANGSVKNILDGVYGYSFNAPRYIVIDSNTTASNTIRNVDGNTTQYFTGPASFIAKNNLNQGFGFIVGNASFGGATVADKGSAVVTVTVSGAIVGNAVAPAYSQDLQGMSISGYVSAADTVKIVFNNNTGGSVSLAAGTATANVLKFG